MVDAWTEGSQLESFTAASAESQPWTTGSRIEPFTALPTPTLDEPGWLVVDEDDGSVRIRWGPAGTSVPPSSLAGTTQGGGTLQANLLAPLVFGPATGSLSARGRLRSPLFSSMITPTTLRAYEALGPIRRADLRGSQQLLLYLDAMLRQLDELEQLIRDTDEHVGWGRLLDLDETPPYALPWLAQFVGVRGVVGLDSVAQKIKIREAEGWKRGTVDSIRGAMRQHLTGDRTTQVFERWQGNAYQLRVRTFSDETPDPDLVEAAVRALKPAGLALSYEVSDGQNYGELRDDHVDYEDVLQTYDDYDAVRYGKPPEV